MRTRCAVLIRAGYSAQAANVCEVEALLLGGGKFDRIIVSYVLTKQEKARIISAAGQRPTLLLNGFTIPEELLGLVEQCLDSAPGPQRVEHAFLRR